MICAGGLDRFGWVVSGVFPQKLKGLLVDQRPFTPQIGQESGLSLSWNGGSGRRPRSRKGYALAWRVSAENARE